MGKIKFLVMDVDGTLTDGKIYMGPSGEAMKAFDIKDGAGIALELPKLGITPVIITARESKILENRSKELGIEELHQGSKDKMQTLVDILERYGEDLSTVAYVGDDLPDMPCMLAVKETGGLVLCPADAIPEIRDIADYVSTKCAGDAAVRDCINYLKMCEESAIDIENEINEVVDCILKGDYADGMICGHPYVIQEYMTKDESECVLESHRKHVDVQYMLEGAERLKLYGTYGLLPEVEYDSDKDFELWTGGAVVSETLLVPGSYVVVHRGQPHKGAICVGTPYKVKKLVCKIEV